MRTFTLRVKNPLPTWGILAFLVLVTLMTHYLLVPVGFEFLDGDFSPDVLVANEIRQGKWSAFYFGLPYGGVVFTFIRALWVAGWEAFSSDVNSHVTSQMTFTFLVCPALMAVGSYFLVRAYCSRFAAFWVGLLMAVNFQFLIMQCGNDVYTGFLLLGFGLLTWRASLRNPLMDLGPLLLFVASALSGLALFSSRATAYYVLAFFLPWDWFYGEVKRLCRPRGWTERLLFYGGCIFMLLFLYLEAFGPDMGEIFGKRVRVHAQPNFNYGLYLFLILELKIRWRQLWRRPILNRFLIVGAGVFMGFSPELVHFLRLGQSPPPPMADGMKFEDMMSTVGSIPKSLQEFFAAGPGIGENASLLIVLLGFYFLFRRSRKDQQVQPLLLVAILSVFAYCRYHTYVFATPRYLMPILPAALVSMGCFWDEMRRRGAGYLAVAVLLFSFHVAHHWNARVHYVDAVHAMPRKG